MAKRHRALPTVPTIMRLSVVALLIVLPAAAYAAVYPRQPSPYSGDKCGGVGSPCQKNQECCPGFACEQPLDFKIGRVCFIVYSLRFTLGADLNAELPRLLGPSRRRNLTYVGINIRGRSESQLFSVHMSPVVAVVLSLGQ